MWSERLAISVAHHKMLLRFIWRPWGAQSKVTLTTEAVIVKPESMVNTGVGAAGPVVTPVGRGVTPY